MIGSSTIELRIRWSRLLSSCFRERSETAFALSIGCNRLSQLFNAKIRPEDRRTIKLGVCGLPDQKVAQPKLAGRANNQVRVGQSSGVQMLADRLLGDRLRRAALSDKLAHGMHDLV